MADLGWIALWEARDIVIEAVKSRSLAERLIVDRLRSGAIQWKCVHAEGYKRKGDPGPGDAGYWTIFEYDVTGRQRLQRLRIDWDDSSARPLMPITFAAYGVLVPRADVQAMLKTFAPSAKSNTTESEPVTSKAGRRYSLTDEQKERGLTLLRKKLSAEPGVFVTKGAAVQWLRCSDQKLMINDSIDDRTVQRHIVDPLWPSKSTK